MNRKVFFTLHLTWMIVVLTLLDIIIVMRALLWELKATFKVVAWNKTRIV